MDFFHYGCDDGNLVNGDGCTEYCTVERGYTCNPNTGAPTPNPVADTCYEICGDGHDFCNTLFHNFIS